MLLIVFHVKALWSIQLTNFVVPFHVLLSHYLLEIKYPWYLLSRSLQGFRADSPEKIKIRLHFSLFPYVSKT